MTLQQKQIYDVWRITDHPKDEIEAEIRALCQSAYLGDHLALCRVLGRYKMYVDTRDIGIASHLMLEGFWELWVTKAMMGIVPQNAVVADIGANLGYFTLLLADLVGHNGKVLSFEPNPMLAPLVRKSVAVNGFDNRVEFHQIGLGAAKGHAVMDAAIDQPGGGRTILASRKQGSIRIERLDKIPHAGKLDFIKMDVEGFEPNVWKGMTRILRRGRAMTIFMEFTVGRLADPGGFLDEITSHGFSLEIISHDRGIIPVGRETILGGPRDVDHMLVFRRGKQPRPARRAKPEPSEKRVRRSASRNDSPPSSGSAPRRRRAGPKPA